MIGTKKLADIKKELREKFGQDRKRVQNWLGRKQAELSGSDLPSRRLLEELRWVEKLLREAVDLNPRAKRTAKPKARKARAVSARN